MSVDVAWTVAAVVVGLQLHAFARRVQREIRMGERGEPVWLPPAEWMNLAALVIIIGGVFVLPVFAAGDPDSIARQSLALGLVLLAGNPFALAGHYGLMNRGTAPSNLRGEEQQPWASRQERVVLALTGVAALVYLVLVFAL